MNERIKEIRKASSEKTLEKFGAKIGISGAAVSKIENGITVPTRQTITSICSAYNVNEEWLRTGEGDPYRDLSKKEMIAAFFGDVMREDEDSDKIMLIEALAKLDEEDWSALAKLARKIASEINVSLDD